MQCGRVLVALAQARESAVPRRSCGPLCQGRVEDRLELETERAAAHAVGVLIMDVFTLLFQVTYYHCEEIFYHIQVNKMTLLEELHIRSLKV